ncbi:ArsR/SmtB family transcription factor [Natrarchaeobius oligotrophus]|uniref:ArsR family transcriptional regulator n=1 Tax=Natrarchaeobius chitinivorans TaxID=1679083 RepID=A0A3N6M8H4_NATCH|nr:winged helix-turn-helix domain-containing protein [Natrarchaeobius chitinivorans]RQG98647.1 ArsR family transcriptional regulator [Natrarchaeobius chitinivorans]
MTEREIENADRSTARERVEAELLNGTLDFDREVERIKAIGEPTRFIILYLLAEENQMQSGELADQLDRKQNDLYHHLNTLEEAGLVGKFRENQSRVYELSPLAEEFVPQLVETIHNRANAV